LIGDNLIMIRRSSNFNFFKLWTLYHKRHFKKYK